MLGFDATSIAVAPEWLVELILAPKARPTAHTEPPRGHIHDGRTPYGQAALEREMGILASTPDGQKNEQLNRSAFRLAQLIPDGHLSEADIVEALERVALRIGLETDETLKTIRSGIEAGKAKPRAPRDSGPAPSSATGSGHSPHDIPGDPGPVGDNSAGQWANKNGSAFRFVTLNDMPLMPPQMIVPPLLEDDALIQLFGESGAGKTFCASDFAFSTSSRTDFHGLKIRKAGHVIYQIGEGIAGFRRRARAWEIVRGVDLSSAPLSVSTRPLGLIDKGSADIMCKAIDHVSAIHGPPVLLVVDTLARNFGAGDESSTKDMNAFIAVMDKIRTRYGCSILLVHHPGHGDKTRGRGAYSLPAAVDVNLRLEKDSEGLIRLEAIKMKEAEIPPPLAFKLASVDLGMVDEDGQPVTSAVLRSVEYTPRCTAATGKSGRGKWQTEALAILDRLTKDQPSVQVEAWRRQCTIAGMTRQTWSNVFRALTTGDICQVNNMDQVSFR